MLSRKFLAKILQLPQETVVLPLLMNIEQQHYELPSTLLGKKRTKWNKEHSLRYGKL